ncbi:hypothetical protein H4R21_001824 [Coemansia helicoidea]|uniref:Uncharacterized protein n=1 Tax=Coemansia helicoidea TaxID=1286919 RepID=A0ACC1LAG1_9FUNG|nr:hypothetical protein H4R21_001824 [Coemansia helicoidea]
MSGAVVAAAERFVEEFMGRYDCSHDWHHVQRVVRQALALARAEARSKPVDVLVVQLAALLHDVDDAKYQQEGDTPFSSARFLAGAGLDEARAAAVARIIDAVSFRKELLAEEQDRLGTSSPADRAWRRDCVELACVQDADRLDAIGAFGVLRCAAFSGARGRPLHDPSDVAIADITYEQYVGERCGKGGTAVAHFHEKLLRLASMMKTEPGRQEAQRRRAFMCQFLDQLDGEYAFGAKTDQVATAGPQDQDGPGGSPGQTAQ